MQAAQPQQGKAKHTLLPVHTDPSSGRPCVNLAELLHSLPWMTISAPDEGPDPSELARRLAKDAEDCVPMWDLSIALDALRLLLWPIVPGDMPPGGALNVQAACTCWCVPHKPHRD